MAKLWLDGSRNYREQYIKRQTETSFRVVLEETDLHIIANKDYSQLAYKHVQFLRGELKNWIALHPKFLSSLSPLPVIEHAPELIKTMLMAGIKANVGPFAAVAGAIAQSLAVKLSAFSSDVLVENGGDIYIYSSLERKIGLLPDPASLTRLGLKISPQDCPLSLCASSATIGHSLSFGQSELVVTRSQSGAVADAFATAFGNMLHSSSDIQNVLDLAKDANGIDGVFVQCQGQIGVWGQMELCVM